MIPNIAVGPPVGAPGYPARDANATDTREDKSGSFAQTLDGKKDSKAPAKAESRAPEKDDKPPKVDETSKVDKPLKADKPLKEAETKPPKVRVQSEKNAPPGRVNAKVAREKAIKEFMDSFESEFQIPPTRIVEAMASIEPKKQTESPEETASEVIKQLGLPKGEQEKAMASYAGLLAALQQIDHSQGRPNPLDHVLVASPQIRAELLATQQPPVVTDELMTRQAIAKQALAQQQVAEKIMLQPRGANLTSDQQMHLLSQLKADRQKLIQEMNDLPDEGQIQAMQNFEGAGALEGAKIAVPVAVGGAVVMKEITPKQLQALQQQMQAAGSRVMPSPERMKLAMAQLQAQANAAKAGEVSRQAVYGGHVVKAQQMQGPQQLIAQTQIADPNAAQNAAISAAAIAAAMKASAGQDFADQSMSDQNGSDSSSDDSSQQGYSELASVAGAGQTAPLKMDDLLAAMKGTPLAVPVGLAAMNQNDHQANIHQLMNQAQYLIKNGGGEMKVQMTPEGLGTVNLKVLVQDGKVNVQMATQSSEAKKAIETALPELKTSLAAHKLSVDHVKVDVVSGPSTDVQTRNDASTNSDSRNRDARQAWEQFHQNFGGGGAQQREAMWDMQSIAKYQRSGSPTPMSANQSAPVAAPEARRVVGKGNGLNLVA